MLNWVYDFTAFMSLDMFTAALLAVAFVGLAKGGLTGFSLLGVPLLMIYMSPLQVAALLLPSYLVMDAVALWTWRQYKDWQIIRDMLPAAMLGIGFGMLMASFASDALVKLLVGLVTLAFVVRQAWLRFRKKLERHGRDRRKAVFWGTMSGFTSFLAHAGGPPFQIYVLPLRLDPKILTGTATVFFAVVNFVKIFPYFYLGEFSQETLTSTLVLMPVMIACVFLGAFIVKRMRAEVFYPFTYAMVSLVALKLIADGVKAFAL